MSDQADWLHDHQKGERIRTTNFTPKYTYSEPINEVDSEWEESKRKWKENWIKQQPTHDLNGRRIIYK